MKIFGEQHTIVFKSSSTRDKWAGLLRGLVTKEVEDSVRRLGIDLSDESVLPDKVKKSKGSESDKMKALLNENTHLTEQLAKISHSMLAPKALAPPVESSPARTPRSRQRRGSHIQEKPSPRIRVQPPTILLFYGPRFSGKTDLAKCFVNHFRDKDIRCAYVHEKQLSLSALDPTMRQRKIDADLQLANVSITKALLQSILDISSPSPYQYIIVDGEFYETDDLNALRAVLDQLKARLIVCCCYAPLTVRKERNLKDLEVRQCKPFEMPAKGVFVDMNKSAQDILENQILPILSTPETPPVVSPNTSKGSHIG